MIWDINPTLFRLGFLEIRYYGLVFVIGILLGYHLWRWQIMRHGYSEEQAEGFPLWGIVAVVVGARLGHCLFYEPGYYLSHPLAILQFWQGGLASHGATIALMLALYLYHRSQKIPLSHILDAFSMSACMGAIFVRVGNFLNSEIVGRVTDVSWAVRFPRYEWFAHYAQYAYPGDPRSGTIPYLPDGWTLHRYTEWYNTCPLRHPSQIYEVFLGLAVFVLLFLVDRVYREKRPNGILASLFLSGYFTGRFLVEYVKEYQTFSPDSAITMGQLLSIPFALIGYIWLILVLCRRKKPHLRNG